MDIIVGVVQSGIFLKYVVVDSDDFVTFKDFICYNKMSKDFYVTETAKDIVDTAYVMDLNGNMVYGNISELPLFVYRNNEYKLKRGVFVAFARGNEYVALFNPFIMLNILNKKDDRDYSHSIIRTSIVNYIEYKRENKVLELIEPLNDYYDYYMRGIATLDNMKKKASLMGLSNEKLCKLLPKHTVLRNSITNEGEVATDYNYKVYKGYAPYGLLYIPAELVEKLFTGQYDKQKYSIAELLKSVEPNLIVISKFFKFRSVPAFIDSLEYSPTQDIFRKLYKWYEQGILICEEETPDFKMLVELSRIYATRGSLSYIGYVAGTVQDSIVDGPGLRYTIFLQGCHHHCKGCHNPQTWAEGVTPNAKLMSVEEIQQEILSNSMITGITISGGEPLNQLTFVRNLAKMIIELRGKGRKIENVILYTGYTLTSSFDRDIKYNTSDYFRVFRIPTGVDYVIDGQFDENQKDMSLQFRGSRNQRIIDIAKTKNSGDIITIDKFE